MRLKQIEIKDYKQFEHLVLNLTYPEGHTNARPLKLGDSLDKVCIIGDNGTGKTTILKLIRDFYMRKHQLEQRHIYTDGSNIFTTSGAPQIERVLYFPTGPDLTNIDSIIESRHVLDLNNKRIHDFSDRETLIAWKRLTKEIQDSINEEIKIRKELFTAAVNESDIVQIKSAVDKLEAYKASNSNGLEKFKKFIDQILNRFHLELDTSINLDRIEKESFLKVKSKNGDTIPRESWSTGIRQLIFNILPLYSIDIAEETLILIDEPERSLYPNTQKILIDFYTGISPNSQFIFATHSPIIAAQFEPWEIIDLRFNEKGKVERKLYYDTKKGNHVDNYFIHPKYLRWDSLFELMFGLEEESNPERTEKLMELALLDRKIKSEKDDKKKEELWNEYNSLANLLDWKTNGTAKTSVEADEKN